MGYNRISSTLDHTIFNDNHVFSWREDSLSAKYWSTNIYTTRISHPHSRALGIPWTDDKQITYFTSWACIHDIKDKTYHRNLQSIHLCMASSERNSQGNWPLSVGCNMSWGIWLKLRTFCFLSWSAGRLRLMYTFGSDITACMITCNSMCTYHTYHDN